MTPFYKIKKYKLLWVHVDGNKKYIQKKTGMMVTSGTGRQGDIGSGVGLEWGKVWYD